MASKIEPWVGLVWVSNVDPTVGAGVAAPLWQPLIRTDDNSFWYKSGTANTAWTELLGGGGSSGVIVDLNGTPIVSPATTLNLTGAGVTVTDAGGGVAHIDIPGATAGVAVEDEGTPLAGNPQSTINFVGAGVTATEIAGVATVTIPGGITGIDVQNGGVDVVNPATGLDFTPDFIVTDEGGGIANIALAHPPSGITIQTGRYTASGAEDPTGFPIVFAALAQPIVSPDANYNAIASGGGMAFVGSFDCPVTSYLSTGLTVVPTSVLTAGDVLIITIISFPPPP